MATYKNIQDDVKNIHNITITIGWIAHVKELNGLPLKKVNYRAPITDREHKCPDDVIPIIEESMRRLGMLR